MSIELNGKHIGAGTGHRPIVRGDDQVRAREHLRLRGRLGSELAIAQAPFVHVVRSLRGKAMLRRTLDVDRDVIAPYLMG